MTKKKKERHTEEQQSEADEQIQAELEGLLKERDELLAKLQRVAADYDNYQKRAAKQIAEGIAHEKESIIKALLPVLDNFPVAGL